MRTSLDHWLPLAERTGIAGDAAGWRARLVKAYGERRRAYHTVQHLEECWGVFDEAKGFMQKPDFIELALWLHDAVYDPKGELPGVVTADEADRHDMLEGYAVLYLEEEIRREGLGLDWGKFQRFLQLAAAESGQIVNYAGISKESTFPADGESSLPAPGGHVYRLTTLAWTHNPREATSLHAQVLPLRSGAATHCGRTVCVTPDRAIRPWPIFEQ